MPNLKEYQNEIEKLIAEENLPKAYEICNRILSYDPENGAFIRLKIKIEKLVQSINRKAIGRELNELEHFLKDQQYAEYLKAIAPLQSYVNQYPEIGRKILDAKKKLDQEYQQRRESAYQEIIKEIKNKSHDHEQIIQKLESFKKLRIHLGEIERVIKTVKKRHVSAQIQKNNALINSNKFEDILLFLLKLKKFDPQNMEVVRLIKRVNSQYRDFNIEDQKDFIFKTTEEMKMLYLSGKYDYCAELARRILRIDEKNSLARQYLNKASQKADQSSEQKMVKDIFSYYKNFRNSKAFKEKDYFTV